LLPGAAKPYTRGKGGGGEKKTEKRELESYFCVSRGVQEKGGKKGGGGSMMNVDSLEGRKGKRRKKPTLSAEKEREKRKKEVRNPLNKPHFRGRGRRGARGRAQSNPKEREGEGGRGIPPLL